MDNLKMLKQLIYKQLVGILDKKLENTKKAIESSKESRDNDTKSSAGDKFETGRAMMQMEVDKNELQLRKTLMLKRDLSQIDIQKEYESVEFGSFVITDHGNYFISIGIGKIDINKEAHYAISLASPIGKVLHNKKIGDKIKFQEREFIIKNII